MGDIKEYSCKCGYEKTLNIGVGIRSIQPNGDILRYYPASCTRCRELFSASCMIKKDTDPDKSALIPSLCPKCDKQPIVYRDENFILCPKCAARLTVKQIGDWD